MRLVYLKLLAIPFFAVLISLVLAEFGRGISHLLSVDYNSKIEFMVVFGQIAFQYLFIWKLNWEKQVNYLFNLMTVSLVGALLLTPFLIWNHFYPGSDLVSLVYFFSVVIILFLDHKRRVKRLELSGYLSYTWGSLPMCYFTSNYIIYETNHSRWKRFSRKSTLSTFCRNQ